MRTRPAIHFLCTALLALGGLSALAAEPVVTAPSIELVAEGSAEAANDLASALAYFEATDANPATLADKVNKVIAEALATTRSYPSVKAASAGTSTYPVYNRDGRTLEAWRMRSQIQLESRDMAAISKLIGNLQSRLAVSQISLQPAPDTRRAAEDTATVAAIEDFQRRARLAADSLGRKYRIQHLSINQSGGRPPVYMRARVAMASADAAPAPIEAGESSVTVSISGTVDLID